jgi:hypothetical protein
VRQHAVTFAARAKPEAGNLPADQAGRKNAPANAERRTLNVER